MATVAAHYDHHLATHYTWMAGGAAAPQERFSQFWAGLGLKPSQPGATALDLGAGSGFQSLPLARAGYHVTALDLSAALLSELTAAAATLPIAAVRGDIRDLARHCPTPSPEVILCLGDTLTHLATREEVSGVLRTAAAALCPGGHLLLGFRDYTTERTGSDRFIAVRSDSDRIFTCMIEYSPTHLNVNDIVHTRNGSTWSLAVSSYPKIRLAPGWVIDQLLATGLTLVRHTTDNGLVTLVARRAAST